MPRSLLAITAVAAAIALVVAAALSLAGALDENGDQPPPAAVAQGDASTARVVERVREGVALVTARRRGGGGASGSAFMIDDEGLLIASRDVVAGATSVSVRAEGATGPILADVLGADPLTGVAVLKIPRGDADALEPLTLGDDESVRVGEPVIAVGAPFALEGSVTAGIVSALDRTLRRAGGVTVDGAIRTDARVDAGNAGGPLVDSDGRVIGVNALSRSGAAGAGFAIPIDTAEAMTEAIRDERRVGRTFLGVATVPVSPGLAQVLGLPVEHGLLVRSVAPGGPAARSGLRPARSSRPEGDVIVTVDGQAVRQPRDAALAVADREAGDRIVLEVARGQDRLRIPIRLARIPD